ncbi:MAG: S1 RNA-binding domain-containing protein [Evtepia sp.]
MSNQYLPEGQLLDTPENKAACSSYTALQHAMEREQVLEGRAILCTPEHDLLVSVGEFSGIIRREESALGIREGKTREIAILSRVGKAICFTVVGIKMEEGEPIFILSRRRAQELAQREFLETLPHGTIIPATVTHMENFGVFVDIACGFISMIGIENISVSRISHPNRRFHIGQKIHVAISGVDHDRGRIFLTHKELLGTWSENAEQFMPGMTVSGYVRGLKEYGAFIELTPNLTGLADRTEDLQEDDRVSVFIKAILPERMKIKLLIIHRLEPDPTPAPLVYYQRSGCLGGWCYAPENCCRVNALAI